MFDSNIVNSQENTLSIQDSWGSRLGFIALVVLLFLALSHIHQYHLQALKVEVIAKRAHAWEINLRFTQDENSDTALVLYEYLLNMAPEPSYYLASAARAYTLKAHFTCNDTAYKKAEDLLSQAQKINPLNVDHSIQLASLYASWAGASNRCHTQ